MSNEAEVSSKPFAPYERKKIRVCVEEVEDWVEFRERREWLVAQGKMWAKWAGGTMGVVTVIIQFWPTITEIFNIILKAHK